MRQQRAELARQYLETIVNEKQRMVCFLLMKGHTPEEICRQLRISAERYELIRMETEIEMRNFGLAPEDWREEKEEEVEE